MTARLIKTATIALIAIQASSALATIHHVPSDHATIQAAIMACVDGDEVIVADGIYMGAGNRDLNFLGRLITVRSENGPDDCIIDCEGQARGFIFDHEETNAAVLEGFTIQHGSAPTGNGAGIDMALGASPSIRNCILRENTAISLGGGIAVRGQCNPIITGCTFINNVAVGSDQGAQGGGLCLFFLSPATVTDCVFIGNFSRYGGGLSCGLSDATIVNCLFVGNEAQIGGGGVACDVANPTMINCTFVDNVSAFGGAVAGISSYLECNPTIQNSILWRNTPNEIQIQNGFANVDYSDVQGGWPGVGNIDANPLFAGPSLLGGRSDYEIRSDSPCVDAGSNLAVPPGITTDLNGDPRFVDNPAVDDTGFGEPPLVDMGAFEVQVCIGDLDGDGDTDQADLGVLLSSFGVDNGGDLDGDGDTDQSDLGLMLSDYGCGL